MTLQELWNKYGEHFAHLELKVHEPDVHGNVYPISEAVVCGETEEMHIELIAREPWPYRPGDTIEDEYGWREVVRVETDGVWTQDKDGTERFENFPLKLK